jgi:predicted HicB family RNase H-like nuclease
MVQLHYHIKMLKYYQNMDGKMNNIKTFNIRIPRELWVFLKKSSVDQDRSMNEIIVSCIEKLKKKKENKLTSNDAMVL